ncbi:MAG TPA: TonB-dependent receptor, partial [Pyrinomonadaceae bacterium]|nr:TonB-dependent receptor [Pyrinomonadaceae bacterium]
VPRHLFTFRIDYGVASRHHFGLQGRASGSQFDDDQNQFRLAPFFTLDAFAARRLARGAEVFAAAENLTGRRYEVGRTPLTTLGPPLLVRVGLRLNLGSAR